MSRVNDFYTDAEFEALLDTAEGAAKTDKEETFISDLRERYDEYGDDMFLSDAQNDWLTRIVQR